MNSMRAVTLKAFGDSSMLQLSRVAQPTLSRATDLLIKVAAAGVNRADIVQRHGHYPPPPGISDILGLEVSGVVVKIGEGVRRFREGDRVMALLGGGGYAEFAVAHEGSVMKIPDGYSFAEAAAIPEAFITAWQLLKQHGKLAEGERVLVHAGASGVGTAVLQLANKVFKANTIATCSAGKVEFCRNFSSLVVDRAPDTKGSCFLNKIRESLGDNGVDVIVDPVAGGTYLNEDATLLARDGRIVVIAFMGGSRATISLSTLLQKRASIIFSKLRDQTDEYKASLVESFETEAIPYLKRRVITPVLQRTFSIDEVGNAHRLVEENQTNGKVVLTL
ncbi:putative oxidoreductase [Trypanosoma vivax]|uniref:Putative oxidoreductase n=1 Tax=Trypanosoma vivax (strain Y486) TaxID=1055687 RepID=G0TTI1_TRYVY|nr:putative oxidoreductase [Trypanosoma vivax]CCC47262.1 putative oxidoreductase [Trypanosoma vivax Y486]